MTLTVTPVEGLPEIGAGDDLAQIIVGGLGSEESLRQGDVLVIAHKVVSKAEGRTRSLAEVQPQARAHELAAQLDKDPRQVQVVLDETREVLRAARGVMICVTHHGFVCANAGVDASNVPGEDTVLMLPVDPDRSARALRERLRELTGVAPAVIITDSFGRAWRIGQCDVTIGCAGMAPLEDWRGRRDAHGRELRATWIAVADELAAAADLARRQGRPAAGGADPRRRSSRQRRGRARRGTRCSGPRPRTCSGSAQAPGTHRWSGRVSGEPAASPGDSMSEETVKYLLREQDIPTHWINLLPDLPGEPLPPLHPGTLQPAGPDDLAPIFPMALILQEVSSEPEVEIPEDVREMLQAVAPDAAVARPPAGARTRYPGAHLLQVRGHLAGRLAQAQHGRPPGLRERAGGHHAPRHGDRRRAMGLGAVVRLLAVRAGVRGVHGRLEL